MKPEGFVRTFSAGRDAVESGSHDIEGDPRASGRWGPSIVLLPRGDVERRLADLTSTAAGILDDEHWLSGGAGRAHITVRALEPFAPSIDSNRLQRYEAALRRALDDLGSLRFELRGVGVSTGSVMVCTWEHDGKGMAPQVAASLPATGER